MAVFWPDSTPVRARSALHSTVYRARRALGKELVEMEFDRYIVGQRDRLFYDVAELDRCIALAAEASDDPGRLAALDPVFALARGEYLAGELCSWCTTRREELRVAVTEALLALADIRVRRGEHSAAIAAYRRALELDELREDIHRGLMRAYAASGDRARALRQYEALTELLLDELDTAPDSESQILYRSIRQDGQSDVEDAPQESRGRIAG
jgi:DNA-binding SARP family transcriptional activator